MRVVGLITEYNPFHNGHLYHIQKSKEVTHADFCIVVMSGNFVQRGTPAMIDKYFRARMALLAGADVVLELPVPFATASAEFFASAAIRLLDSLGVVNAVCFGSECADLQILSALAHIFNEEPFSYQEVLRQSLQKGNSYPKARAEAVLFYLKQNQPDKLPSISPFQWQTILTSPNNILGIEYLKALERIGSSIMPYAISRVEADYHSKEIHSSICSATAVRSLFEQQPSSDDLRSVLPDYVWRILQNQCQKTGPVCLNDFSLLLNYCLTIRNDFSSYAEVSKELADRIRAHQPSCHSFEQWADLLKSKSYTRTRICRGLLHILLDITKEDMAIDPADCLYARILGFCSESTSLLSLVKKNGKIPLITKMADASERLNSAGKKLLEQEVMASHIYRQIVFHKFGTVLPDEYRTGIIKI